MGPLGVAYSMLWSVRPTLDAECKGCHQPWLRGTHGFFALPGMALRRVACDDPPRPFPFLHKFDGHVLYSQGDQVILEARPGLDEVFQAALTSKCHASVPPGGLRPDAPLFLGVCLFPSELFLVGPLP